jgi:hypothetical protein
MSRRRHAHHQPPADRIDALRRLVQQRFPHIPRAVVIRDGNRWTPLPPPQVNRRFRHGRSAHAIALAAAALAALALSAAPTPVQAGTLDLDVNAASYHLQSWARHDLNQRNPGLGLEYHFTRTWAVMCGEYKNSYRRPTWYALAAFTPLHLGRTAGWHLDAGLVGGLATGYTHTEVPSRPFVGGAIVRLRAPDGIGVNFIGVPNGGPRDSGFIGLQIVYRLP